MSNSHLPHVDNFLSRLKGVRPTNNGWDARCPCRNDDENPSLSVGIGAEDKVLVSCHRGEGCSVVEICQSVGLKVVDLYPPHKEERKLTLIATYDYRDENGILLFQKQRFTDQNGKKTFRQRRPDPIGNGKWIFSLDNTPKILYRLPQVLEAKRNGEVIWLVEGEKDADAVFAQGMVATTPPNGAGKWLDIHSRALEGATVFIVADNDEVGRQHAISVGDVLSKHGCVVNTFVPPTGFKDVSDLINAGRSLDDLLELDRTEPSADLTVHDDEEQEIEAVVQATSPIESLTEQLVKVLENEDLSESTRINRASMLVNSFGVEDRTDRGRLVNWAQLVLEDVDDSYDWVIPNVLERGERVILVASEGIGKTMLMRQIAICSSYGIHPFTMSRMKPIRTLTIDLENPEKIIKRTSASIHGAARHLGYLDGEPDCHILMKPSGVDLMRPADKAFIEQTVERIRPDLLLLGPIYKSFVDPGGRTSEAITVEIAKYFDMLRDYYKCALWMEHHAPLGTSSTSRDLRPFGSAVWSRWPEFGLSLTPDPTVMGEYIYDVRHFRGARDLREFPTKMRRGKIFPFEVLEFTKV